MPTGDVPNGTGPVRNGRPARVSIFTYGPTTFDERPGTRVDECLPCQDPSALVWVDVDTVDDPHVLDQLGHRFGLHPLVLEDIRSTDQRPKVEDYEGYLYVVLRMLRHVDGEEDLLDEQVSLVLGPSFVLSFQTGREGDVFDPVRERLRTAKGPLRKLGADYLAYALIDAIVDHCFLLLERVGDRVEDLGDEMVQDPQRKTLADLHRLKRELLFLRKSVWPLRDVIARLERGESALFQEHTLVYLRDVHDHAIQVADRIDTYRDMLAGMFEIYLSSQSNRMNEVMKVLTIIATIFMPLTFIAGVYGMNFRFLPEVEWRYGYAFALGLMALVALAMLLYFKRRNWL
jgi:magnesium transporter